MKPGADHHNSTALITHLGKGKPKNLKDQVEVGDLEEVHGHTALQRLEERNGQAYDIFDLYDWLAASISGALI